MLLRPLSEDNKQRHLTGMPGGGVQVLFSERDELTRVLRETGAVAVTLGGGDAVGAHRPPV